MFQRIQSKLSSRITFLIAIILVIVFGIETVLITNYLTDISRKNTENEIELRAESISKDVRNIFENANLVTRQMALNKEITTVFLMPNEKYTYLNSTIVREVAEFGGNVDKLVTPLVAEKLREKFRK